MWDEAAGECVTTTEFVLRRTPKGSCTQVGRVSENRGYDPDKRPSPRLKSVDEERGAC